MLLLLLSKTTYLFIPLPIMYKKLYLSSSVQLVCSVLCVCVTYSRGKTRSKDLVGRKNQKQKAKDQ